MDRNTLLAFFLISLVLVFTPKYMEMVSPTPDPGEIEPPPIADSVKTADQINFTAPNNKPEPQLKRKTALSRTRLLTQNPEKLLSVNTSLYSATLSSVSGGSFASFEFNQYFKKGNQIYIEGSLESRSFEDQNGDKRFITEVLVNNFQFVDSKSSSSESAIGDDSFLDDFEVGSSSSDDVPF